MHCPILELGITISGVVIVAFFPFFRLVPPSIVQSPVANATVSAGENFMFSCTATGQPLPVIQWLKDSSIVNQGNVTTSLSSSIVSSFLKLVEVDLEQAGVYYCNASNDLVTERWSASSSCFYILCEY